MAKAHTNIKHNEKTRKNNASVEANKTSQKARFNTLLFTPSNADEKKNLTKFT
jgi:hypothetical protein